MSDDNVVNVTEQATLNKPMTENADIDTGTIETGEPVALLDAPKPLSHGAQPMGVDREAAKRDASRYRAVVNAMRSLSEGAKVVADDIEHVLRAGHPELTEERIDALRTSQRGLMSMHEGLSRAGESF